jgi:hypothetical protein
MHMVMYQLIIKFDLIMAQPLAALISSKWAHQQALFWNLKSSYFHMYDLGELLQVWYGISCERLLTWSQISLIHVDPMQAEMVVDHIGQ